MIINANSWHGKMRAAFYNDPLDFPWFPEYDEHTTNGCLYLRDIFIWSWVTILACTLIGTFVVGSGLFMVVDIATHIFGSVSIISGDTLASGLAYCGYIILFAFFLMGIITFGAYIVCSDQSKKIVKSMKDSIVGTTVKSISEKICPIVEYK